MTDRAVDETLLHAQRASHFDRTSPPARSTDRDIREERVDVVARSPRTDHLRLTVGERADYEIRDGCILFRTRDVEPYPSDLDSTLAFVGPIDEQSSLPLAGRLPHGGHRACHGASEHYLVVAKICFRSVDLATHADTRVHSD